MVRPTGWGDPIPDSVEPKSGAVTPPPLDPPVSVPGSTYTRLVTLLADLAEFVEAQDRAQVALARSPFRASPLGVEVAQVRALLPPSPK